MRSSRCGGRGDRSRAVGEQPRHFGRRLQMALGIGEQPPPGFGEHGAFADAGQHVVQRALFGRGIERVVGGEQRHAGGFGQRASAAPAAAGPPRRAAWSRRASSAGRASATQIGVLQAPGRRRARPSRSAADRRHGRADRRGAACSRPFRRAGCPASAAGSAAPSRAAWRDRR